MDCKDVHCALHGGLKTRGAVVEAIVVSNKPSRTAIVQRELVRYVAKYERYGRTNSKIAAHLPDCLPAKVGDVVRVEECRKISKVKAWVVTAILKKDVS